MPVVKPIQNSFAAGAFAPTVWGRSDIQGYREGSAEIENMVINPRGPLIGRFGTEYLKTLDGSYGRLFSFYVNQNRSYIVCFLPDGNGYVLGASGSIVGGNDLGRDGAFMDGQGAWTDVSSAKGTVLFDVGAADLIPGNGANSHAAIQYAITQSIPGDTIFAVSLSADNVGQEVLIQLGTSPGAGDLVEVTTTQTSYLTQVTTAPGTLYVTITVPDAGLSRTVLEVFSAPVVTATDIMFTHPFDEQDLALLQSDMWPGAHTMVFVTPEKPPQELVYTESADTWVFQPIVFTNPPAAWTGSNWPGCVTFFQSRLWLGYTGDTPETFWGSTVDSYYDFNLGGASPVATNAMEYKVSRKGAIRWMIGARNFLIGAERNEYIVTSQDGVIIPGDIQVDIQSSFGSSPIQPELVGNKAVYVTITNKEVRTLGYRWEEDAWNGFELNYQAEHYTWDTRIVDIAYTQFPDSLVIALLNDGTIMACTYQHDQEQYGWHRHDMGGRVVAIASTFIGGQSELFLLVYREIDGTGQLYFEWFREGVTLDSVEINDNTGSPTTAVSAPHLANETVGVVANGANHPDITLDSNGDGELLYEADWAILGYRYTQKWTSLPPEFLVAQRGGSIMPDKKRWAKVHIRLYESSIPQINGRRPGTRSPGTPMNQVEPPDTGIVQVSTIGWSDDAPITIEQDLPFPMTLISVFGELATEDVH